MKTILIQIDGDSQVYRATDRQVSIIKELLKESSAGLVNVAGAIKLTIDCGRRADDVKIKALVDL